MLDTMEIFISWHGPKSHAAAEALRDWLPQIANALKPWLSSQDIDKGTRWSSEIAAKLASSTAGIICLTPSNLTAPWILFEAGALSKTVDSALVCPLLIELEPSDLLTSPLGQFQAMKATKDQVLLLMKNLNKHLGEAGVSEAHLVKAFQLWWPELHEKLSNLPNEKPTQRPERNAQDVLEKLVELTRQTSVAIIEADRRNAERFSRFENILALSQRWQVNGLGARPMSSFGSQVFETPFVPTEGPQGTVGLYGGIAEANRSIAEAENAFPRGPQGVQSSLHHNALRRTSTASATKQPSDTDSKDKPGPV